MSWDGCLLPDSELFILFAENSQIFLKISDIPILLTFIYLIALNLLVNNQLNSSLQHIIATQSSNISCWYAKRQGLYTQKLKIVTWLIKSNFE